MRLVGMGDGNTGSLRAQRTGLLICLALVLTSGLFAAPAIAAQQEFGHSHPDGTPQHVHDLTGIITSATTDAVVSVTAALPVLWVVARRAGGWRPLLPFEASRAIRAPPLHS